MTIKNPCAPLPIRVAINVYGPYKHEKFERKQNRYKIKKAKSIATDTPVLIAATGWPVPTVNNKKKLDKE